MSDEEMDDAAKTGALLGRAGVTIVAAALAVVAALGNGALTLGAWATQPASAEVSHAACAAETALLRAAVQQHMNTGGHGTMLHRMDMVEQTLDADREAIKSVSVTLVRICERLEIPSCD